MAAVAGRLGQACATLSKEQQAVVKEVQGAMQQGATLVQASLERLQNAEASWDRDVRASGAMFDGFPTAEQVR